MKQRPHWRGLPIPFVAFIADDGTPDFRVTDQAKRHCVIQNRLCQLCGQMLGKWIFFVGGPEAAKANQYFEPACHLDCLMYAMQVCPFIAGKMEHADIERVAAKHPDIKIMADETFSAVKNPMWVIKKARGWKLMLTRQTKTLLLSPIMVVKETKPLHAASMNGSDWRKVMEALV